MTFTHKKTCLFLVRIIVAIGFEGFVTTTVLAEQYDTGMHIVKTDQGFLSINVGHVSHFNAFDFFVYSFMYQPKDSKKWDQVPYIEKEDDPKLLFNVHTKHTPDKILLDAKVVTSKQKFFLIIGKKEIIETLADNAPVTVSIYELVKLDDYERWVFIRKSVEITALKVSVDKALDNATRALGK